MGFGGVLRLKPWPPAWALNPEILIYLLYTLIRVSRILLKGRRAHTRGPYFCPYRCSESDCVFEDLGFGDNGQMEASIVYWGCTGIMGKKMEELLY